MQTLTRSKTPRETGSTESRHAQSWRRTASALSVLCLAAALAGCAPASGGSEGNAVTLTYGIWDKAQQPAMEQIIEEFERENPSIDVRITLTPWDAYWTKLKTAATGGSAPDVFWMMMDRLKLYADGGVLLPLSERIRDDHLDMSNYVDATVEGFTWQDQIYGMPKDTNSFGLFYNKTLFAQAGVPVPDETWTWDDVVSAAQNLTDADGGVYGIGAPVADVLGYYLTIPQAGGYVISPDGTRSGYDDPRTIAGLRFWSDLINRYHVSPTVQQMTDTDVMSMFTSGKIAMCYGGSWDPIALSMVPYATENVAVAPLPKGENRSFYANGIGNVAFAKTEHPEEAWTFLQFLGSKRAAEIQAETGTVIPAFKGEEDTYARALPQFDLKVITDQLPNGLPIPSSIDTAVWSDFAITEFTKAWTGEESVEQAARIVAEQMNTALATEAK